MTDSELAKINWDALGVNKERVPPSSWDWAIDTENDFLCTQLINSSYEMREGYYWYLLIVKGQPFIFMIDAFRSQNIAGKIHREAALNKRNLTAPEIEFIERLSNEAHEVVSYRQESLIFSNLQFYSSM
ncbi:hypothetical protein [Propionivibrio sp.]|uniref:hypothetical protein n=1 Tax=Propionivibrio sp. TaxID=2212460 RepID=UPI0025F3A699|nr:hypothetical protein [Propionivibrio sp.]MBK7356303.1 hypothetical protein [Propionivibrio sp.]